MRGAGGMQSFPKEGMAAERISVFVQLGFLPLLHILVEQRAEERWPEVGLSRIESD